jgi:hypothetical protein
LSAASAAIAGTLTAGASTLASLGVTNNTSLGGTLGVTGFTTLSSVDVTENATVDGTLGVTGLSTLDTLDVTNACSLLGDTFIQTANIRDYTWTPIITSTATSSSTTFVTVASVMYRLGDRLPTAFQGYFRSSATTGTIGVRVNEPIRNQVAGPVVTQLITVANTDTLITVPITNGQFVLNSDNTYYFTLQIQRALTTGTMSCVCAGYRR